MAKKHPPKPQTPPSRPIDHDPLPPEPKSLERVLRFIRYRGYGVLIFIATLTTIVAGLFAFKALSIQTQREILGPIANVAGLPTLTLTPTDTLMPTLTLTPTLTHTSTATFTPTSTLTSTPEFSSAVKGEILIIVAEMDNRNAPNMPTGETMVEQMQRIIDDAAVVARDEYNVKVRVGRTQEVVQTSKRADELISEHGATMLIWGSVDSAGISTYYTISPSVNQQIEIPIGETNFTAAATLDEVAIRFRNVVDQAYVVNFLVGQILYFNKQYNAALPLFESALELVQEESVETLRGLNVAKIYFYVGHIHNVIYKEPEQAIDDFTKAINLQPNDTLAYINRGTAYTLQHQFDMALRDYNKAIELAPNNALGYIGRGIVYQRQNEPNLNQALEDYNTAIELDPSVIISYYVRGTVYRAQNKRDLAVADFTTSIELDPNWVLPYEQRGSLFLLQSRFDQSLADYTKAIELGSSSVDTYAGLGFVYDAMREYVKALDAYSRYLEVAGDDPYDLVLERVRELEAQFGTPTP